LFGGRLQIDKELGGSKLPFILGVISLPALFALDGVITQIEAAFALLSYWVIVIMLRTRPKLLPRILTPKISRFQILSMLGLSLFGVGVIFLASRLVVDQTMLLAEIIEFSPFVLSLILISIGTNLPEFVIGIRAIFLDKKSLAFADYVGSSASNTMLLGLFGLAHSGNIYLSNNYLIPVTTTILGIILFFIFAKSGNKISFREALTLLFLYLGFLAAEIIGH
jgi:Ca2+/Na+ antiporter